MTDPAAAAGRPGDNGTGEDADMTCEAWVILDWLKRRPEGLTWRQLAAFAVDARTVRRALGELLADGRVWRLPLGPKPPPGADETWLYFTPTAQPDG